MSKLLSPICPVLGAFWLVLLAGTPPLSAQTEEGPTLVFESDLIDLGEVEQRPYPEPLDYPFEVRGGDFLVESIDTSCGCTEAVVLVGDQEWDLGQPLPEGTEGLIRARFDGTKYQHNKASTIDIRRKGALRPIRLRVQAFIKPMFVLQPVAVRFLEVPPAEVRQEAPKKHVRVVCTRPFEIKSWKKIPVGASIRETPRSASGEFEPHEGEAFVRVYQIVLLPDAPSGLLTGQFVAETDLGRDLEIAFYADVRGPVTYLPPRIRIQAREGKEKTVRLKVRPTDDSIEVPEPSLRYEGTGALAAVVEKQVRNGDWILRVTVPKTAQRGVIRGKLWVEYPEGSDLPAQDVPVLVTVRPPR